jgi:hypothetical protein
MNEQSKAYLVDGGIGSLAAAFDTMPLSALGR